MWKPWSLGFGIALVSGQTIGCAPMSDASASGEVEEDTAELEGDPGGFGSSPLRTFVLDGIVYTMARLGNTLYLGGSFTQIGQRTGPWVALSEGSGDLDKSAYTEFGDGEVRTAEPDGSGGWYVAGSFTRVGREAVNSLVHVNADGSQDPNFHVEVSANSVNAIARNGNQLFIGGTFSSVAGSARAGLAAVDANSGALLDFDAQLAVPPAHPGTPGVKTLALAGGSLFVAGFFDRVQDEPHSGLAAIELASGRVRRANIDCSGVEASLSLGDSVVVGGGFETIGGQQRRSLAILDGASGAVTTLPLPSISGSIYSIASSAAGLFVGGNFDNVNGSPRDSCAALDLKTGALLPWTVEHDSSSGVRALAAANGRVFISAPFEHVNGVSRLGLVAVNEITGAVDANFSANGAQAEVIRTSGSHVFVGGGFRSVGVQPRSRLAAIDLTTRRATNWKPKVNASGGVFAMTIRNDTVYVGGVFSSVNNVQRPGLAAVDALTGAVLPWHASVAGFPDGLTPVVRVLASDEGAIYAAGDFAHAGGADRLRLAGFDPTSGDVTAWNPNAPGQIDSLAVLHDRVLVGGHFQEIGGAKRNNLAAVDKASGLALPWNPDPDNEVSAVTVDARNVYVAGRFKNLGGVPRDGLAIIDRASGALLPGNPGLAPSTLQLVVSGDRLIAGGSFSTGGGKPRTGLAAFDLSTAALDPWAPELKNFGKAQVKTVVVTESAVWAAGIFFGARSGHVIVDQQNLVAYPIN